MGIIIAWNHWVMEETSIGISDALTLMNVDHERVQFYSGEIIDDENIYIIVGVHLYTKFPLNYIVLQCEQPGSHWMYDKTLYEKFENSMGLWEISPKLNNKWRTTTSYESYYVPTRIPMNVFIDFGQEEKPVEQDIDILFYGGRHPKRVEMERILREKFPRKNIVFRYFNLFDEERENVIQRSKIVLNIHYWPEASLETHRIEYLMARNKCVVTERSMDTELDNEYKNSVVFTKYEKMPETIDNLLKNPEEIERIGSAAGRLSLKHQLNLSYIKRALLGCSKNIKSKTLTYQDKHDDGVRVTRKEEIHQGQLVSEC